MTLLAAFLDIAAGWRDVFPQSRTFQRAVRQALGSLVCLGRRYLSRIIWTNGGQHRSWGAEYFLHSRCEWQPQELFRPILQRALTYCPGRLVGVAVDDTRLSKSGRCIQAGVLPARSAVAALPRESDVGVAAADSTASNGPSARRPRTCSTRSSPLAVRSAPPRW
jgi:hypothetical protein